MPCLIFRIPFRNTILLCGGDGTELECAVLPPLFFLVDVDGASNKYFDFRLAVNIEETNEYSFAVHHMYTTNC